MTDNDNYEAGVRAGTERFLAYFLDENEYSMYEGLSRVDLSLFQRGAILDALADKGLYVD